MSRHPILRPKWSLTAYLVTYWALERDHQELSEDAAKRIREIEHERSKKRIPSVFGPPHTICPTPGCQCLVYYLRV